MQEARPVQKVPLRVL